MCECVCVYVCMCACVCANYVLFSPANYVCTIVNKYLIYLGSYQIKDTSSNYTVLNVFTSVGNFLACTLVKIWEFTCMYMYMDECTGNVLEHKVKDKDVSAGS